MYEYMYGYLEKVSFLFVDEEATDGKRRVEL
jgi:hypothetical protein